MRREYNTYFTCDMSEGRVYACTSTDVDYGEELRHIDQSYAAVNLHFSVTRRFDC